MRATVSAYLAGLVQPVGSDEIVDILLAVLGEHLEVAPEHSDACLGDWMLLHKLDVQRPDSEKQT